MNRTWHH